MLTCEVWLTMGKSLLVPLRVVDDTIKHTRGVYKCCIITTYSIEMTVLAYTKHEISFNFNTRDE